MLKLRNIMTLLLIVSSVSVWGRTLDLDLQDAKLRVNLTNEGLKAMNGSSVELGWLYSEESDDLVHLGWYVRGENWSKQGGAVQISLGGRLYGAQLASATQVEDDYSMGMLALGGMASFSPLQRLTLMGRAYHAPDITSFGDADGITEVELRLNYRVIPQAFVYLGYRYIQIDLEDSLELGENDTVEMDNHINIGFRLLF